LSKIHFKNIIRWMLNTTPAPSAFEFADGREVLLYTEGQKGRVWVNNAEAFHRAHIFPAYVEFRLLNDDGVDLLELGHEVHAERRNSLSSPWGQVDFSRKVLFEDSPEWLWHARVLPSVDTLNMIGRVVFESLGAHSVPLQLLDGDGRDYLFKPMTILRSLAEGDGFIPVSTHARHFRHDVAAHGIGNKRLHIQEMRALQALARFTTELESTDIFSAIHLATWIAYAMDYYTFMGDFSMEHMQNATDPMFTMILKASRKLKTAYELHVTSLLREQGFSVLQSRTVARPAEIVQYHNKVKSILRAKVPLRILPEGTITEGSRLIEPGLSVAQSNH
jgi:hypothetical protein